MSSVFFLFRQYDVTLSRHAAKFSTRAEQRDHRGAIYGARLLRVRKLSAGFIKAEPQE